MGNQLLREMAIAMTMAFGLEVEAAAVDAACFRAWPPSSGAAPGTAKRLLRECGTNSGSVLPVVPKPGIPVPFQALVRTRLDPKRRAICCPPARRPGLDMDRGLALGLIV